MRSLEHVFGIEAVFGLVLDFLQDALDLLALTVAHFPAVGFSDGYRCVCIVVLKMNLLSKEVWLNLPRKTFSASSALSLTANHLGDSGMKKKIGRPTRHTIPEYQCSDCQSRL